MRSIEIIRTKVPGNFITEAEIVTSLGPDTDYHSCISRLVKNGDLVRIRNGIFIFGQQYSKGTVNLFSLANLVYGPSYVSLDSALSFYGLIPERVTVVTSVNRKRPKRFDTPLGIFWYRKVPSSSFSIGITPRRDANGNSRFLIAVPEKALLDKLYLDWDRKTLMLDFLLQGMRLDEIMLHSLSRRKLLIMAPEYGPTTFTNAVKHLTQGL